jgi:nitroimidazol reductase NimA-like FMN-containing flavoprotein (pyridoxamine 5'-phosphate oxidase superfamily)
MEQPGISILNANRIMTIGTIRPDGWPQTTMVGFANQGWRVYFLIYRTSQKFRNISLNPRVSISVGQEPSELRQIKAVYAGGMAHEVEDLVERSRAWTLLAQRHPNLTDLAPPGNDDEVATMVAECRYVSVLDYSKGLGHSEDMIVRAR